MHINVMARQFKEQHFVSYNNIKFFMGRHFFSTFNFNMKIKLYNLQIVNYKKK